MKNNSQYMFLVNFTSNEVCFVPQNTDIPALHDWYPVVIDHQGQSLSDIMNYNFENMKQLAINDIVEIKEERISTKKNINGFKWPVGYINQQKPHIFVLPMLRAS